MLCGVMCDVQGCDVVTESWRGVFLVTVLGNILVPLAAAAHQPAAVFPLKVDAPFSRPRSLAAAGRRNSRTGETCVPTPPPVELKTNLRVVFTITEKN